MKSDVMDRSYKKYNKEIYLYALSLCRDETIAEDLVSEAFFKAFIATNQPQVNTVVNEYIEQPRYTEACEILNAGFEDAFQYTVAGQGHNRLKSTNVLERLNEEVRRHENIIRIFPNQDAANRLIGAVLMDKHEEWVGSNRKYISLED